MTHKTVDRSHRKRGGRTWLAIALTAGISLTGAVAAHATDVSVGGGNWHYSVRSGGEFGSGGAVLSQYRHPKKENWAKACDGNKICVTAGWTKQGMQASAIKWGATQHGNTAYWNVR